MVEEQQHILGLSADAYLGALKPKENMEFHIRRLEQEMQLLVLGAHTLRPLKNKENNLAKNHSQLSPQSAREEAATCGGPWRPWTSR